MRKRRARLRILKSFPVRLEEIACAKALDCDTIEIWFADEARIGQKNKTTRRWAKRGTRPSAPRDQRTASTYIFGAVCPKRGKGAALQYRSDEPAPCGDRRGRCTRRPRCPLGRSGRLAHVDTPGRTGQHHHHRAATQMSRAQPG